MNDRSSEAKGQSLLNVSRTPHPENGPLLPLPKENFDALLNAVSEYMSEGKLTEEEYDRFCTELTECTPKDHFHRPPKPSADPSAGEMLYFETIDFSGNIVKSKDLFAQKKLTMLNLWDTTCLACITEMPHLTELSREFEQKGVQVVGLAYNAVDAELVSEAKDIAEDLDLSYLNLLPNEEIRAGLYSQSFPVTYFVDRDGKLLGKPIYGAHVHKYRIAMESYLNDLKTEMD